jgi:hypothetical protein
MKCQKNIKKGTKMKRQKIFLEKLAGMILIMAMIMPQYATAAVTEDGTDVAIDANDNVTVNVDSDEDGTGDFIVTDENGSLDTITTIISNAQSTVIGAGDANTITNSLTVAGTGTTNSGPMTLESTGVTGATTLSSTLDVSGNLTATGTTNTIGAAGSSANTITGATNTITGATTVTSTGTANQMIVDATSSRFVSADGFSNATVGDDSVGLLADSDALSTNARSSLSMAPTSASLLVNTDSGVSHGISIGQTSTVISGGTTSTSLTLDDNGATFQDDDTGGPAKVTGVADGVGGYDAVNMRQYRKLEDRIDTAYSGIASVAAIAAIPAPVPGKDFSVGVGFGNFESQSAIGLGGKALVGEEKDITLTAGVGFCNDTTVVSAGVGWSF